VSPQLKLIALDTEDLAVISAHVQDARVRTSGIVWRQREKRLAIGHEPAGLGTDAGRRNLAAPPDRDLAFPSIWVRNDKAPPGRPG
jgi:hypothetical protein